VIYCVVPPELESELFEKLVAYYADNPDVTVVVDRRSGPNRRRGPTPPGVESQRELRDRRRRRLGGAWLTTEPPVDR